MFSQLEAPDWPNIPNVQIINKRVPHTAHGTKTRNAEEGQLPPCPQKLKRVSWGTENRNSRGQGFCREMQSSNPQTNAGLQQRNEILLKICTLKKKKPRGSVSGSALPRWYKPHKHRLTQTHIFPLFRQHCLFSSSRENN